MGFSAALFIANQNANRATRRDRPRDSRSTENGVHKLKRRKDENPYEGILYLPIIDAFRLFRRGQFVGESKTLDEIVAIRTNHLRTVRGTAE